MTPSSSYRGCAEQLGAMLWLPRAFRRRRAYFAPSLGRLRCGPAFWSTGDHLFALRSWRGGREKRSADYLPTINPNFIECSQLVAGKRLQLQLGIVSANHTGRKCLCHKAAEHCSLMFTFLEIPAERRVGSGENLGHVGGAQGGLIRSHYRTARNRGDAPCMRFFERLC